MERNTPYTTSAGLRIGCAYERDRRPRLDSDALRLQGALLNKRQPGSLETALARLVRSFWAWC